MKIISKAYILYESFLMECKDALYDLWSVDGIVIMMILVLLLVLTLKLLLKCKNSPTDSHRTLEEEISLVNLEPEYEP